MVAVENPVNIGKAGTDTKARVVYLLEFDPIPYINAFENCIQDMKRFYLTVEKRVDRLTLSLEQDSGEVHQKTTALSDTFEDIFVAFQKLNGLSDKISATAVRIGKQIECIYSEKKRAEEAREILSQYIELNNNSSCVRLDALLRSSTLDAKIQLAKLLKQLQCIAMANIPGTEKVYGSLRRWSNCLG